MQRSGHLPVTHLDRVALLVRMSMFVFMFVFVFASMLGEVLMSGRTGWPTPAVTGG